MWCIYFNYMDSFVFRNQLGSISQGVLKNLQELLTLLPVSLPVLTYFVPCTEPPFFIIQGTSENAGYLSAGDMVTTVCIHTPYVQIHMCMHNMCFHLRIRSSLHLWQMFLYEAAGILVVASPLPPDVCTYICACIYVNYVCPTLFKQGKCTLMSELLLPLVQKFPLYLEQVIHRPLVYINPTPPLT